jgi:hypothetical protein
MRRDAERTICKTVTRHVGTHRVPFESGRKRLKTDNAVAGILLLFHSGIAGLGQKPAEYRLDLAAIDRLPCAKHLTYEPTA